MAYFTKKAIPNTNTVIPILFTRFSPMNLSRSGLFFNHLSHQLSMTTGVTCCLADWALLIFGSSFTEGTVDSITDSFPGWGYGSLGRGDSAGSGGFGAIYGRHCTTVSSVALTG